MEDHRRRQREMESVNNESGRSYQVTWTPPAREQGEDEEVMCDSRDTASGERVLSLCQLSQYLGYVLRMPPAKLSHSLICHATVQWRNKLFMEKEYPKSKLGLSRVQWCGESVKRELRPTLTGHCGICS